MSAGDTFLAKLNGLDIHDSIEVVEGDVPDIETVRAFARMGDEVVFIPITKRELADKLGVENLDSHVLMIVGATGWVIPDGHALIEQTYDMYTDIMLADIKAKEKTDHGET